MASLKNALDNIAVGDIFHAESPNGASLICLVLSVTDTIVCARTVTTQLYLEFGRKTGIATFGDAAVPCTVDSVAPLPPDVYNVMLGIDLKFRTKKDPEQLKLSSAEKRALVFVASYYATNRL